MNLGNGFNGIIFNGHVAIVVHTFSNKLLTYAAHSIFYYIANYPIFSISSF